VGDLSRRVAAQLQFLCRDLPSRAVGSPGNRAATDWFARQVTSFGFEVETPEFECIEWEHSGADLRLANTHYKVFPSPYTLGCEARGRLCVVDSLEALERAQAEGTILLIHGSLAKEQLMPKGFPFYNPRSISRSLPAWNASGRRRSWRPPGAIPEWPAPSLRSP